MLASLAVERNVVACVGIGWGRLCCTILYFRIKVDYVKFCRNIIFEGWHTQARTVYKNLGKEWLTRLSTVRVHPKIYMYKVLGGYTREYGMS